jgi:hypothetical protein
MPQHATNGQSAPLSVAVASGSRGRGGGSLVALAFPELGKDLAQIAALVSFKPVLIASDASPVHYFPGELVVVHVFDFFAVWQFLHIRSGRLRVSPSELQRR